MKRDDLRPDPELAAELRAIAGEPPVDAVDWPRLGAALAARAARPLERLRRRPLTWWEQAAGWGRTAVPLAIAASIALVLLLRGAGSEAAAPAPALGARAALEQVIATSADDAREMVPLMLGAEHEEWLLRATLTP